MVSVLVEPLSNQSEQRWQLWSTDYFDRDAPPYLEQEGEGLLAGCVELWHKTLEEGVLDDGRPTFTGFFLRCGTREIALPRDPLKNSALAHLRQWREDQRVIRALAAVVAGDPERIDWLLSAAMRSASVAALLETLAEGQRTDKPHAGTPEAGCLCDRCGTATVVFVRHDPPGVQLFRCTGCGEVKRWCPACGQGWLVHYLVDEEPRSRYICDDCQTVWDSGWKRLTPLREAYRVDEVRGTNHQRIRDIEQWQ